MPVGDLFQPEESPQGFAERVEPTLSELYRASGNLHVLTGMGAGLSRKRAIDTVNEEIDAATQKAFGRTITHKDYIGEALPEEEELNLRQSEFRQNLLNMGRMAIESTSAELDNELAAINREKRLLALQRLKQENPELMKNVPVTEDEILERIKQLSKDAKQEQEEISSYFSPTEQAFYGTAAVAAYDIFNNPLTMASLPFGAARGASLLGVMGAEAGIAFFQSLLEEPDIYAYNRELGFDYDLGDSATNVLASTVGSGALGAGFSLIGRGIVGAGELMRARSARQLYNRAALAAEDPGVRAALEYGEQALFLEEANFYNIAREADAARAPENTARIAQDLAKIREAIAEGKTINDVDFSTTQKDFDKATAAAKKAKQDEGKLTSSEKSKVDQVLKFSEEKKLGRVDLTQEVKGRTVTDQIKNLGRVAKDSGRPLQQRLDIVNAYHDLHNTTFTNAQSKKVNKLRSDLLKQKEELPKGAFDRKTELLEGFAAKTERPNDIRLLSLEQKKFVMWTAGLYEGLRKDDLRFGISKNPENRDTPWNLTAVGRDGIGEEFINSYRTLKEAREAAARADIEWWEGLNTKKPAEAGSSEILDESFTQPEIMTIEKAERIYAEKNLNDSAEYINQEFEGIEDETISVLNDKGEVEDMSVRAISDELNEEADIVDNVLAPCAIPGGGA